MHSVSTQGLEIAASREKIKLKQVSRGGAISSSFQDVSITLIPMPESGTVAVECAHSNLLLGMRELLLKYLQCVGQWLDHCWCTMSVWGPAMTQGRQGIQNHL